MNTSFSIPTNQYNALREAGLKSVEKYSQGTWTDYNTHDPGITLLEYLCYALTDLSNRTHLDMESLLHRENLSWEHFFPTSEKMLPHRALTINDYRKKLIDIPEIKNAWIQKVPKENTSVYDKWQVPVFSNTLEEKATLIETIQHPDTLQDISFPRLLLKGLYQVHVQFHDIPYTKHSPEDTLSKVWNILHQNRSLCEDFLPPLPIKETPVGVCIDIQIQPGVDTTDVLAQCAYEIDKHLSPSVSFHSLQAMQNKGYATEDIFNGPALSHGFIEEEELEQAQLNTEIHASDIIQLLMDIPGVLAVRSLQMTSYDVESDVNSNTKEYIPHSGDRLNQKWVLPIHSQEPSSPVLCLEKSRFIVYRDNIPYYGDMPRIQHKLYELKAQHFQRPLLSHELFLQMPKAKPASLKSYTTIQNDFPLVYGISQEGLPKSATEARKAEAKQLQGFLLLLEQFMANYVAQLNHVTELYSSQYLSQSYFTQQVEQVRDFEKLCGDSAAFLENLQDIVEDSETYQLRRNRFLEHLLARLGENFAELPLLLESLYGQQSIEHIITDKSRMLRALPWLNQARSAGSNYLEHSELNPLFQTSSEPDALTKRLQTFLNLSPMSIFNIDYFQISPSIEGSDIHKKNGKELYFANVLDVHQVPIFTSSIQQIKNITQVQEGADLSWNHLLQELHFFLLASTDIRQYQVVSIGIPSNRTYTLRIGNHFHCVYEFDSEQSALDYARTCQENFWESMKQYPLERQIQDLGYEHFEIYEEQDEDDLEEYRFRILDANNQIVLSSVRRYTSYLELYQDLLLIRKSGIHSEHFSIQLRQDKYHYKLVDSIEDNPRTLAYKHAGFDTLEEAQAEVQKTMELLRKNTPLQKVFVIEHMLLRPHAPPQDALHLWSDEDLLSACITPDCATCSEADPYSFRISVVLPYAVPLFRNMNFRQYTEDYIREHTPAHILAKICWVDSEVFHLFDKKHSLWRKQLSLYYQSYKEDLDTRIGLYQDLVYAQRQFLSVFQDLNSVYPEGYLHNCKEEDTNTFGSNAKNPMILGSTQLGTFEDTTGSQLNTDGDT